MKITAPKLIGVIGQGYVGLEVSIGISQSGIEVLGFEKDVTRISTILRGVSPVENVSSDVLKESLARNFKITSDMSKLSECDVIIICVPTPLKLDLSPNLEMLESAINDIAKYVVENTLIVNESTSYPGTLRELVSSKICDARPDIATTLRFGVAPERVNPGSGVPLRQVGRVVSGLDEEAKIHTFNLYSCFCSKVTLVDTPEIAEASKLLENTFRLVNIAFINEFNLICRELNIDTRKVIDAASTKPFGFSAFQPSFGIGGHCIPVDPLYLQYAAKRSGRESNFVSLATQLNSEHASLLLKNIFNLCQLENPRVLLLGVAYKPGLSDTRESPAERLAQVLLKLNVDFGWYDPLVTFWRNSPQSNLEEKWDIAIVVTAQDRLPIDELLGKGVKIFDATGRFSSVSDVVQI